MSAISLDMERRLFNNSQAFSPMIKPLEAYETNTRNKKMTSQKRLPREKIIDFDIQDSKQAAIVDPSLPKTASHIYTLKKGFYGSTAASTANLTDQLTRADSTSRPDIASSTRRCPDFIKPN